MLKKLTAGISAGILITIGGTVYLSCSNKYIGAVLFSVALLCICYKGYSLFTGKVGYIPESHSKEDFSVLLLGLLGNAIGTILGGILIRYALSNVGEVANTICLAKLEVAPLMVFVRSVFCGILMYLAVSIFRDNNKNVVGILFCIPVFILCGFEHSIADMFYLSASGIVSFKAFLFVLNVIAGNSVGGMLLPIINGCAKWGNKNA